MDVGDGCRCNKIVGHTSCPAYISSADENIAESKAAGDVSKVKNKPSIIDNKSCTIKSQDFSFSLVFVDALGRGTGGT
jgi:hypothetical protein